MPQSDLPPHPSDVPASMRGLLSAIVDYAGSFPPASLPLGTAFQNYMRYLASPWSWMVARFVSPAGRLVELSDDVQRVDPPSPYRFSVLASGGTSADRFVAALEADLRATRHFQQEHGGRIAIDQIEARLPSSLIGTDVVTVRKFVDGVADELATAELTGAAFFFELPLDGNLRQTLPVLTGALRSFNRGQHDAAAFGVKMRTGSTDASAVPTVDQVAHVIVACRDADIPCKATAGLHHPVRRVDTTEDPMHGFVNVFLAAALADVHALDEMAVARILSDTDPSSFTFAPDRASWLTYTVDVPAIERARRRRVQSFGSCSFHEPVANLRTLQYL